MFHARDAALPISCFLMTTLTFILLNDSGLAFAPVDSLAALCVYHLWVLYPSIQLLQFYQRHSSLKFFFHFDSLDQFETGGPL